ncbi:MAG: holo-ACP synthase [Candidatus Omnitrophota bacterium]
MITGCGIDIVEVKRIKNAVNKWGKEFLKRIFTERELECAKNRNFNFEHLAGRFAVKEAVVKALNDGKTTFRDIEVLNKKDGMPYCIIKTISYKKDSDILISISHIKTHAIANAIIQTKS